MIQFLGQELCPLHHILILSIWLSSIPFSFSSALGRLLEASAIPGTVSRTTDVDTREAWETDQQGVTMIPTGRRKGQRLCCRWENRNVGISDGAGAGPWWRQIYCLSGNWIDQGVGGLLERTETAQEHDGLVISQSCRAESGPEGLTEAGGEGIWPGLLGVPWMRRQKHWDCFVLK